MPVSSYLQYNDIRVVEYKLSVPVPEVDQIIPRICWVMSHEYDLSKQHVTVLLCWTD